MTTRVRVAVRIRPLLQKERDEGCQTCLTVMDSTQILLGKDKPFTYDYAFGSDTAQEDVFHNCAYPLIEAIFKGFNSTMLAYGQTGSGKTFTMGTSKIETTEEHLLGIIPRVIEHLFCIMEEKKSEYEYIIRVSFLEIYNEELKDLLNSDENNTLTIREDGSGIKVTGLSEVPITSPTEALNLLCKGGESRVVGSTKMNEQSSRSHAIFTLHIEQKSKSSPDDFWSAKFHLVDLAGSERIKKTGAEGDRRKEGININLGLLALGNVVSALGDIKNKATHIPYRDSKLTRLLQDSLGGNSYTLMMACVSPADSNMEETLNTLRYADRAKKIKNKPVVNRDPHLAEILRLKALVSELQGSAVSQQLSSMDPIDSLEYKKVLEKNKLLEEQNEKLAAELTNAIDHSNELCEKIILMEMSKDKLKGQLAKITVQTGISLEELDNSLKDAELKPEQRERLEKVKSIQEAIIDIDKQKEALEVTLSEFDDNLTTITELSEEMSQQPLLNGEVSAVNTTSTSSTLTPNHLSEKSDSQMVIGDDDDTFGKAYTLHRAKMSRQLKQLNDMLTAKETIMNECVTTEQKQESLKKLQNLETKIKNLEEEKDKLQQLLACNKTSAAVGKISEQRRQRLKELEQQMAELRLKLKEHAKIVKMKEQTDKELDKLNKEILLMKQQRVRLMKQIKEESERFRRWKMEQDKKVMQLKAKDRKMQCEMAKMEMKLSKTQKYYKQRADEAALANKRLKDALDKQRLARESKSQATNGNDKELSAIGPRVKSLVADEIDMQVSVREAERLLEEQTKHRAELNKELQSVKSTSSGTKDEQVKLLQSQLTLCTAQISEFNQKLQDAKLNKSAALSERMTSMVEARCAIRYLLSLAIESRLELLRSEQKSKESSSTADSSLQRIDQLEREIMEMEEYHINEMKITKLDFDRKMAAMKKQMERNGGHLSDLKINSMDLDITALHDELDEKNRRIEDLEAKLLEVSKMAEPTPQRPYGTPKAGALFPDLDIKPSKLDDVKVTIAARDSKNIKIKAKIKVKPEPAEEEDMMEDEDEFEMSGQDENDDPADLSWHATPEIRRMRRVSSFSKCSCTTKCARASCSCKSNRRPCGPLCGCKLQGCLNTKTTAEFIQLKPKSLDNSQESMVTTVHNETYTKDSTDDSMEDSSGVPQEEKSMKRNDSTTSLDNSKRRKLLSSDKKLYFGSP